MYVCKIVGLDKLYSHMTMIYVFLQSTFKCNENMHGKGASYRPSVNICLLGMSLASINILCSCFSTIHE